MDDVDLLCSALGMADRETLDDFLGLTVGPLGAREDRVELLAAVASEARHPSARAASSALGVLPRTVTDRRRRALRTAGLDDEPYERLLMVTAAVTKQQRPPK